MVNAPVVMGGNLAMNKVALYTIFRCTNYGAVLQAFALSRILRTRFGEEDVDVINHRMDPRDNHLLGKISNPETPWFQRWRNKHKFARRYYRADLFEVRRMRTVRLIEDMIRPTTCLYRAPNELRSLPAYRTVIVGSDQIWNPLLNTDFGQNQYLSTNLPNPQDRVAYAGSFGVSELPAAFEDEYRAALKRFRVITCREESGATICEHLIGKRPEVVLDPTMLLSPSEWSGLVAKRAALIPQGELSAYWVRTLTQPDVDALAAFAARQGKTIRLMSAGPIPKLILPKNIIPVVDADPLDFASEISASSAVITDSFHGLQFAVIFEKPVLALGDLSNARSYASRLTDFCKRYDLTSGIADMARFRAGEIFLPTTFTRFDYGALESDRQKSLAALINMIPR